MSLSRYAKKRDANESDIVTALELVGCSVLQGDHPDLIVGRAGRSYLLEVKKPGYRDSDLKPSQKLMLATWNGHYAIVTSPNEALKAIGLICR